MTKNELKFVIATIEDLSVDVESHSWGPTYEIAQDNKQKALKLLLEELAEKKKEK
jgi:hypothetical protein